MTKDKKNLAEKEIKLPHIISYIKRQNIDNLYLNI